MTHQMLVVFGILAIAIGLFVWGRPRADIVALLVVVALMSSRVLTPQEALAGFGSPVVILIGSIFIVSAGLVNTGVAQRLGDAVVKAGRGNETRLVALIMLLAGAIGSVLNSSAIAAMLIPVVLTITKKTGLNRKRLLMPLGVAVMISGMMTLIATSPNIIIENILRERGLAPLSFFSFTPFGVVTLAIGIVFMLLVGRNLLSRKRSGETAGADSPEVFDVIDSNGLKEQWHRLTVRADSPLIGQSVAAARQPLHENYGLDLLGFEKQGDGKSVKHGHGKTRFLPALPESVFEADDVVFTLVDEKQVPALIANLRCSVTGPQEESRRQQVLQDIGVAEVMPAPESKAIGSTLGDLDLSSQYRLTVLALRHRGQPLTENLAGQTVDFGDTLLVGGDWDDINKVGDDRENFVLLTLPAEYQARLPARGRAPIAVGILVGMVAIMVSQVLPNADVALIAALAMVAAGCVRLDSIYRVISWTTLVLIAGMLPLATALTKTGATTLMAKELVRTLGSLGPILMLAVVFLVTGLVSLFISNAATAVLIAPVAIEAAQALHVSPQAFAMTVAIACSAAFVTPVSSPSNMLIMEPGGYRFADYVKVGLPMLLLTMLVTVALAKVIYLPG